MRRNEIRDKNTHTPNNALCAWYRSNERVKWTSESKSKFGLEISWFLWYRFVYEPKFLDISS